MIEDWLSQPDTYSLIKSRIEPALSLCYCYRYWLNHMMNMIHLFGIYCKRE